MDWNIPLHGIYEDFLRYLKMKKKARREEAFRYMVSVCRSRERFDQLVQEGLDIGHIRLVLIADEDGYCLSPTVWLVATEKLLEKED